MEEKPTNELDELLSGMKTGELESYLKENRRYMADDEKAFSYYIKDAIKDNGIKLKDVYIRADVSESYGSKILSMYSHTKNRDMIIRLCIAGHLSWKQTSRALKLYGFNELYSKNTRDSVIISAINSRKYDIECIDKELESHGLSKLSKEE